MPLLTTCYITFMYTACMLDNGSLYTAYREENRLEVYIDGKHYLTINNGRV